jgi:hypothetical protein
MIDLSLSIVAQAFALIAALFKIMKNNQEQHY